MKPPAPISFRLRTALFIAASFTLLLSGYFLASYYSIKETMTTRSDAEVTAALDSILSGLECNTRVSAFNDLVATFGRTGEAPIAVKLVCTDKRGPSLPASGPNRIAALLDSHTFVADQLPLDVRLGSRSVRVLGRTRANLLVLGAIDTLPFHEVEDTMISRFLILLASGLVVSFVIGFMTAGRALKPLMLLIDSATKIKLNRSTENRLPTSTSTAEINRLATIINDVLAERNRNIDALRNFTADAAHELRTPLTILKGELEVDLRTRALAADERRSIESNLEEVHRLIRIVEDLLLLARLEHETTAQVLPGDPWILEELLDECEKRLSGMAEAKQIALSLQCSSTTPLAIQRDDVQTIICNILANAVRYTPEGGSITMGTTPTGDGGVSVAIRDTGIGIKSEDLPHIFDRFWRADRARSRSAGGTGLGLTIAKMLADRHRIGIEVRSTPGMGTTFCCTFPNPASEA